MPDTLWWLPSVILVATLVTAVTAIVRLTRRHALARTRLDRAASADMARTAAISLVRADDLVQSSLDELGYAIAQFGEQAAQGFVAALSTSRKQLRDAFELQQKLDDEIPESDAQRQRWSKQIIALADDTTIRLTEQTNDFDARRGIERDAGLQLEQLARRLERARAKACTGRASLKRLRQTYARGVLVPLANNLERACTELGKAKTASDATAARLAAGSVEPVGDLLREADVSIFRATGLLDSLEAGEKEVQLARAALGTALAAADRDLADARELRDHHEEADTRAGLNRVIQPADEVLAQLREPDRLCDPARELAALREAMNGLDIGRSEARNRQLRLENARSALHPAVLASHSQIQLTRSFITGNRARVGAAARTRLAEAERQLSLAEAEVDPVIALDTVRRAMTYATDADALARYDLL